MRKKIFYRILNCFQIMVLAVTAVLCLSCSKSTAVKGTPVNQVPMLKEAKLFGKVKREIDKAELADLITDKTRLVILNTPHNPTGGILTRETLEEITSGMHQVAEGVKTAKLVMELGERYDVELPIHAEIHGIVHDGHTPMQAYRGLVARRPGREADIG